MRLLVFGRTGQVATELARHADTLCLDRTEADLTDPCACAALIEKTDADAIVNAAAYTAVDRAESEWELAHTVNAIAPGVMAQAAAARDLPFLHISTDYVFDGQGTRPWLPDDATSPLGVYGASKLAGEEAVRAAGGVHAILRTSWVFSARGTNFVKTMLRLGAEREALSIVADQVGGPTPARDIAAACVTIATRLSPKTSGTYHFSGTPDVSWADFARAIFSRAGQAPHVTEIETSAYPTPAARPANSRLDCSTTETTFGIARPDWRAGLDAVLRDLRITAAGSA